MGTHLLSLLVLTGWKSRDAGPAKSRHCLPCTRRTPGGFLASARSSGAGFVYERIQVHWLLAQQHSTSPSKCTFTYGRARCYWWQPRRTVATCYTSSSLGVDHCCSKCCCFVIASFGFFAARNKRQQQKEQQHEEEEMKTIVLIDRNGSVYGADTQTSN